MINIDKAKAGLILDHPFFASLLLKMNIVENTNGETETMDTDGETIRYNPNWCETLTVSELTFVLAHEVMHGVFEHMFRRGERDHGLYNAAADYVINYVLVQDKVGTMPNGGLLDAGLVDNGNATTEHVYDKLYKAFPPQSESQNSQGSQSGQGNASQGQSNSPKALDKVLDAKDTPNGPSAEQKRAEKLVDVIQAANAAKQCGKLSAGLKRLVKEFTKPKVDWKYVLRRFLSEKTKTDWSYARPKRRFLGEDLYLPSLTGEKLGEIVIAVDCSGSIDAKQLDAFACEIKAIIEDTKPSLTHVIYFDSKVTQFDSFGPDDNFEINAKGGGGTAFSPIFQEIELRNLNPIACVVLTDLVCSDFGQCPNYPVLWVSNYSEKAPWGEVLKIEGEL